MADYHTSFSVLLPVGAGNVEAALALYARLEAELEADGEAIGFVAEEGDAKNGTVWIWSGGEGGDTEHVGTYAIRCGEAFSLTGRWGFEYAFHCSRPRVDGFGGGAQMLDLGKHAVVDWVGTGTWVEDRLGAGKAPDALAETALQPAAEAQGWNLHSQMSVLLGFIDGLIAADPGIAGRLCAHLAAVSATENDLHCRECGEPVFLTDTGISHHAGSGMVCANKIER